ncbi:MAG: ATP-binding protein, partial [Bdellovibrionales bacterium]|nr:ATP-binding protein [Bdellovibrionales bacterium]
QRVVEQIVSEKELQHRDKGGIHFHLDLPEEFEWTSALLPETALLRVLSNLIDNAVEALDRSGNIEVSGRVASGTESIISIRDSGKGIPEGLLPHLMQKGATFGKKHGSGLGLFHARETLEKNGGSIEITSELGKGTVVSIAFPAVVVQSEMVCKFPRVVSDTPATIAHGAFHA